MNLEKIKNANTKYIGKEIEYFKEISSTHTYAKEIALKEKHSGKIIIAETQTAGIGTKGRSWYTGENNNIAMTIILKPTCEIEKLEGLTIKIAECMKKTIYTLYQIQLEIKEPNDLILNGKKIGGILTEINTMGEIVDTLFIGIGFNVKQTIFSENITNKATSLYLNNVKDIEIEDVICAICNELETIIEKF